ncbi:MAG: ATP synthase F1 subunit delta [Lachnospiraceae bacterium]|nr:ATP synthase F1 subunit delta [Lachnospiraceae bacterium]
MAKLVSKTYGEALYSAAAENGRTTEIMQEIEELQKILDDNPEFEGLMLHPGIPKQEKQEIINSVFGGRVSDELSGFFRIVVENERYRDLTAIFEYYTAKVKEADGIGIAYVTTAEELTETRRAEVKKRLLETTSYNTMEMHYRTDTSLIGGMVIRIGDRVVDSSIRTKLNDLTRQLLQIQLG